MTDTTKAQPLAEQSAESLERRMKDREAERASLDRRMPALVEDRGRALAEGRDADARKFGDALRTAEADARDLDEALKLLRSHFDAARQRETREAAERTIARLHRSVGGLAGRRPNDIEEARALIAELEPLLARIFGGAARQRWTARLTGALGELFDLPVPQSKKMLPLPEKDAALTDLRRRVKSLVDSTSAPGRPPGGTGGQSPEEQIELAVAWLRDGFEVEVQEVLALPEGVPPSPAAQRKAEENRRKEEHARRVAASLSRDPVLQSELQRAKAEEGLGLDPAGGVGGLR